MGSNNKNKADRYGSSKGIFLHNKSILRKTATVCALCGMPLDKRLKYPDPMSVSIDHIIPIALGGSSTLDNLQAAHLICNKEKGKKLLIDPKNAKNKSENDKKVKNIDAFIPQYLDWTNYSEV